VCALLRSAQRVRTIDSPSFWRWRESLPAFGILPHASRPRSDAGGAHRVRLTSLRSARPNDRLPLLLEVAGVPSGIRHPASCLQAALGRWRRTSCAPYFAPLSASERSTPPPFKRESPPNRRAFSFGGGGSRTRVLARVPWASTGLDVHCIVGGCLAARRAASPYPGCSRLLTFRPESRPASIATGIRPLKAAQPVPAFYRLRGESVTVVVGS